MQTQFAQPVSPQDLSKLEVVAQLLRENQTLSPTEIVAKCKERNIEINNKTASVYKSNLLHNRVGQHPINGKPKPRRQVNTAKTENINLNDLETIVQLKRRYGPNLAKLMELAGQ